MRNTTLAMRTKETLRRHRLSTRDVAERVGVDQGVIWKMTSGRRVSVETLEKFARTFDEDPGEWIALGRPELAGAMDRVREEAAPSPSISPRGLLAAPHAGVIRRAGLIAWESAEARRAWGEELIELTVETTSLGPVFAREDRLLVRRAETAGRGEVVVVAPATEETPGAGWQLVRFAAPSPMGLRVADVTDTELAEAFDLPGARVQGVLAYRITEYQSERSRQAGSHQP